MYALAINGSPRKGGNTETLLQTVLQELQKAGWETELQNIGGTPMRGCTACQKCFENKDHRCILDKDAFNDVFARMEKADAILLGSPTYFADVTSEMKALLDRAGFVAMANGCTLAGKIGAAVVAVRRGGAIHVFDTINHLYQISRMIIPGSTYWNMAYGLQPGDVESDDEGLANMRQLGQAVDWLGKATTPHRDQYPMG